MSSSRDTLFTNHAPERFTFDRHVAAVFDDMIQRSVPGYALSLEMLGVLAARYGARGKRIYDLGCSLGAGMAAMLPHVPAQCRLIGVDASMPMLARARQRLTDPRIHLICGDIGDVRIQDAGLVVLNFTLQFIPPARRLGLLRQIRQGLRPGGALALSEKITFADADAQQWHTDMHESFKRLQGYSQLEISRKRAALEQVLLPETLETHCQRLQAAGFQQVYPWFQCFNFASMIAIRDDG